MDGAKFWINQILKASNPISVLFYLIYHLSLLVGYGDNYGTEGSPKGKRNLADSAEMQQLFRPFRGFCARKGVCTFKILIFF